MKTGTFERQWIRI